MNSLSSSTDKISVKITHPPIRLGQFLKFAGIVENGLEAKSKIQNGEVSVNGKVELRRGRQIGHGDQVVIGKLLYEVDSQD